MSRRRHNARTLAAALLSGPWERRQLEKRARDALGARSAIRAKRIVEEILAANTPPYPPHRKQLERLIQSSPAFDKLGETAVQHMLSLRPKPARPRFSPIPEFRKTELPAIATTGDLARWLDMPSAHLEWFADERRTLVQETNLTLQHYTHTWIPKRSGSWRLIEAPKPRLKERQRRVLHDILDRVPAHDAAFGFVRGRSCTTAAAHHAGEDVVVTVDLQDFFLNTPSTRVHATFRCLGYPWAVARALTGLCCTSTPLAALDRRAGNGHLDHITCQRYATPHLPQGAPTSPALANLAARRLDCRLMGLAHRFEARYTRYADDLTFSGDRLFHGQVSRFLRAVSAIVKDEGFALNGQKTRVMPRSARQTVTGLVVNQHINMARADYDTLKATLTNCARHGAVGQNRDGHEDFRAHLDGRITWVETVNPRRGEKLRRVFETISW